MKRLLALSLVTLALASCGGPKEEDKNDLLDGILDSNNGGEETMEEGDYEVPTSEGPSMLPPEEEETEELTEETNE